MDKLCQLGTARGFAARDVKLAERRLEQSRAEYELRDQAYRQYVSEHPEALWEST